MLDDLRNVIKGEKTATWDDYGKVHYTGISRETTEDIADLLDGNNGVKLSYDDIRKGLEAIIKDSGAENIAAAKRIEFALDRRLREGYTDSYGTRYEPNENYMNFLQGKEYVSPEEYDRQRAEKMLEEEGIPLFSLSEEQAKEVNDYIDKVYEDKTLDDRFKEDVTRRLSRVENYNDYEKIKQEIQEYKDKSSIS